MNKDFRKWLIYESGLIFRMVSATGTETILVDISGLSKLRKHKKRYNSIEWEPYGTYEWLKIIRR